MAAESKKQQIELLTRISGVNDKYAKEAVETLGIDTIDAFIAAARKGELQKISGVGEKREKLLLAAALEYQNENVQNAPVESKTESKKKSPEPRAPQVPPLRELERLTLTKLAIRLAKKIVLKTIRNR